MENELKNQSEAVQASNGGLLAVEQFLQNHYLFRRNVLSGKIESMRVVVLKHKCHILAGSGDPVYNMSTNLTGDDVITLPGEGSSGYGR